MRRVVSYIFIALLTFILGLSAFAFWWCNYSHRPTPETFRAKVSEYDRLIKSEIPVGSSVSVVKQFLDARQIENSDLVSYSGEFRHDSRFEQLSLQNKEEIIKGYVVAIVRGVDYAPLLRWDVEMRFYFDEQGGLVIHTVRWVGTGP